MHKTTKRNSEIYTARQAGESFTSIGKRYEISSERVRRICARIDQKIQHSIASKRLEQDFITYGDSYGLHVLDILRANGIYELEYLREISDTELMKINGIEELAIQIIHKIVNRETICKNIIFDIQHGLPYNFIGKKHCVDEDYVRGVHYAYLFGQKECARDHSRDILRDFCHAHASTVRMGSRVYNTLVGNGINSIEALKSLPNDVMDNLRTLTTENQMKVICAMRDDTPSTMAMMTLEDIIITNDNYDGSHSAIAKLYGLSHNIVEKIYYNWFLSDRNPIMPTNNPLYRACAINSNGSITATNRVYNTLIKNDIYEIEDMALIFSDGPEIWLNNYEEIAIIKRILKKYFDIKGI